MSEDKLGTGLREGDSLDRHGRPMRRPMGYGNRLSADKREGFYRRIFNDKDDRIPDAEKVGYCAVHVDEATAYRGTTMLKDGEQKGTVWRKNVGMGVEGVLMEIPQEEYDAIQRWKAEEIQRKLDEITSPDTTEHQDGTVTIKQYTGVKNG